MGSRFNEQLKMKVGKRITVAFAENHRMEGLLTHAEDDHIILEIGENRNPAIVSIAKICHFRELKEKE